MKITEEEVVWAQRSKMPLSFVIHNLACLFQSIILRKMHARENELVDLRVF